MSEMYRLTKELKPLASVKEIESLLRGNTRDLKKLQDFVNREPNELVRSELQGILVKTWKLAERFDGCSKAEMNTVEFKEGL